MPLLRVVAGDLEGRARHADAGGRESDAPLGDQPAHVASGLAAETCVDGDADAVEAELHRRQRLQAHVALRRRAESGGVPRHQEGLGCAGVVGDHQHGVVARGPGSLALAAVEYEGLSFTPGGRGRSEGVGAEAGLDECHGAGHEAVAQVAGKPVLLLLLRTELGHR